MNKFDKSLTEVWQWKEEVFKDFTGLKSRDIVKRFKSDANKILSGASIKLQTVPVRKLKG